MKITKTDKNTGKTETIFEGKIDKVVVDKSPTSVEPTSDNWTINRRKNQKRAFKFLTHLMILESSIMVENNGDTWFYLVGLLMQDCAELDNAKLYGKIEKYVNDERAGKHNV